MKADELIAEIRQQPSCDLCPPATGSALDRMKSLVPELPSLHREVLSLANGIQSYFGHLSLFGVGCDKRIDLLDWNDVTTWKFAWRYVRLSDWLCFAQDSWGQQYAYNVNELRSGGEPKIYMTNVADMQIYEVAQSFERLFVGTFIGMAKRQNNEEIARTYQEHGRIGWDENLAFSPSLLLGGEDTNVSSMVRMQSRSQLTFDGDIHTHVREYPDRPIIGVIPYQDEKHRMRMRVMTVGD